MALWTDVIETFRLFLFVHLTHSNLRHKLRHA